MEPIRLSLLPNYGNFIHARADVFAPWVGTIEHFATFVVALDAVSI